MNLYLKERSGFAEIFEANIKSWLVTLSFNLLVAQPEELDPTSKSAESGLKVFGRRITFRRSSKSGQEMRIGESSPTSLPCQGQGAHRGKDPGPLTTKELTESKAGTNQCDPDANQRP